MRAANHPKDNVVPEKSDGPEVHFVVRLATVSCGSDIYPYKIEAEFNATWLGYSYTDLRMESYLFVVREVRWAAQKDPQWLAAREIGNVFLPSTVDYELSSTLTRKFQKTENFRLKISPEDLEVFKKSFPSTYAVFIP